MFCEKCGAQLDENAAFCTTCGASVQSTPAQPSVVAPAAAPGTFDANAIVGKIQSGAWFNLSLALILIIQFILYFCELIKATVSFMGHKESDTATIAKAMDSSALTVFGVIFVVLALACIAYLIAKEFFSFSIPAIDNFEQYLLAPAAVSAIFNLVALFVALGHTKNDASDLSAFGFSVKVGFSFGGVLMLILSAASIGLIAYKVYGTFAKKQ